MRFVLLTESLEICGVVFYMHARGNEIRRDEARDFFIRVDLGIQPGTATSHRGRAEIEQNLSIFFAGVLENLVYVVPPGDFHFLSVKCAGN